MGYGYFKLEETSHGTPPANLESVEMKKEFLQNYNDPIIDKFLTYLQQAYLESYGENARSFAPVGLITNLFEINFIINSESHEKVQTRRKHS